MSFAASSCLPFCTIICANIATLWLLHNPQFLYLFMYFIEGGGRNNVSHLDIINWVIFGLAQPQEIFKCSSLDYLTW